MEGCCQSQSWGKACGWSGDTRREARSMARCSAARRRPLEDSARYWSRLLVGTQHSCALPLPVSARYSPQTVAITARRSTITATVTQVRLFFWRAFRPAWTSLFCAALWVAQRVSCSCRVSCGSAMCFPFSLCGGVHCLIGEGEAQTPHLLGQRVSSLAVRWYRRVPLLGNNANPGAAMAPGRWPSVPMPCCV
jgi:hypothetical protein